MDLSPEFTKMCERAVEIQTLVDKTDLHNFWACPVHGLGCDNGTWLPRQDQLQEMIGLSLLDILVYFFKFIQLRRHPSYAASFTSMDQLWLAFVMKERWNKVWDGSEWK